MPIFRVKSVKIYTGQKKFTRVYSWLSWQIWGMVPSESHMSHNMGTWADASKCIAPRQKIKVPILHVFHNNMYWTVALSRFPVIVFHFMSTLLALHLAEFITLLRLYICLHCSCNLSLDFLCILISYKMLYWTHMKNIWPWLGWKDRSKHFEQRPLTPVAESAPDVCCVTQISFFSSLLSIEKCSSNKLAR